MGHVDLIVTVKPDVLHILHVLLPADEEPKQYLTVTVAMEAIVAEFQNQIVSCSELKSDKYKKHFQVFKFD